MIPIALGREFRQSDIPDAFQKEAFISREYLIEKLAEKDDYLDGEVY